MSLGPCDESQPVPSLDLVAQDGVDFPMHLHDAEASKGLGSLNLDGIHAAAPARDILYLTRPSVSILSLGPG